MYFLNGVISGAEGTPVRTIATGGFTRPGHMLASPWGFFLNREGCNLNIPFCERANCTVCGWGHAQLVIH